MFNSQHNRQPISSEEFDIVHQVILNFRSWLKATSKSI